MFTQYQLYQVLTSTLSSTTVCLQQKGECFLPRTRIFELLLPAEVGQPLPYSRAIDELGPAQDAFLCCCTGSSSSSTSTSSTSSISSSGDSAVCGYISTSRVKMQQHVNQQRHIKLTRWSSSAAALYKEHAAQL
ncbi:hypothetical protein EK21DRAFT_94753 [Setomelanomma holmii]|uniref:Uncharacterized protein n=1 Tax=Setomelanomma holmii TaxID=210430 RepID=A0A9P4LFX4_9PLEO|nr:hypothetical protein EK21DRAFT_94753 [Setomelanomma holmii]